MLSEKNYAGAVAKTLELVDTIIYSNYLVIDTIKYKMNSSFLIPINTNSKTPYHIDQSIIKTLLNKQKLSAKNIDKILAGTNATFCLQAYSNKIVTIKDQKAFMLDFKDLEQLFKENKSTHLKKLKSISYKSTNELSKIIQAYTTWKGQAVPGKNEIQFPINSIAAQALMSSDKKSMQMIMKLASFLNDVAISNNEKELKKVIESYALPPGSYKQKRNAWHSVTLNAFAGPYFGYETANFLKATKKVSDTSSIIDFGRNYGISVPIGITYTKTFGKKVSEISSIPYAYPNNPDLIRIKRNSLRTRSNFSMSLTVSVIDIGAVVSYRMNHTENVLDQSFKWEQFISPGFHLGFSIPKTPLMVQLGYQYTPKVRRIVTGETTNGEETIRKDMQIGMWRSYVGVFFDIPLVNLWMKTRSVKFE